MAVARRGSLTTEASPEWGKTTARLEEPGLWIVDVEFSVDVANVAGIPVIGDSPQGGALDTFFSNLTCKAISLSAPGGGLIRGVAHYRGVTLDEETQPVLGSPVWTVRAATGEEKIRVNPNWDAMAAAASAEGGLVEDANGAFVEFTAPVELAGVEAYLSPSLVVTKKSLVVGSGVAALTKKLGKINTPSGWSEIANFTDEGQNWLKIECEADDQGLQELFLVTESWMRSDALGWSVLIYGDPVT